MKKPVAPFLRTPYNYDTNEAGNESALECLDQSLAQQHMEPDTNINTLVEKYLVHGELPQLQAPPLQGDFTNVMTYQEAMNLMIEARQSFEAMPAKIRNRFDNDPGQFVTFCGNEANRDEMRQMGLWSEQAVREWDIKDKAAKAAETALKADGEAFRAERKAKADNQKGVS